ncbi:MAG: restriction endonuclease subunit S [Lachnospiraceae bacterium]|nr:restriction endonuclease subunit S [Lachnospiraceae bacterium]
MMVLAQDLRDSVLQAAIQGKLTEQLSSDTPVPKTIPHKNTIMTDIKIYSDIPDSWFQVKIAKLTERIDAGKSPNCNKISVTSNEWGVITTTAIQWGYFDMEQNKKLPEDFTILDKWKIHEGDVLITRAGPINRTGVACVVKKIDKNLILSDKTLCLHTNYINRDFLVICLWSPEIRKQIFNIMNGMDKQQVNISQKNLGNVIVPFPPIEEQQRIVERVNTLMSLINEYEKIENQLSALKATFPTDMRNAILQAAMQGKLTEQLETDSSVEELIKQIDKERDALITSMQYKSDKKLTPIDVANIPFDIPNNWSWIKLGYCSTYGQAKNKATLDNINSDIWSLDLEDIEKNTGNILIKKKAYERQIKGDKIKFTKGDILYSKLRPYLLKILIANNDGICTPELIPFHMIGDIDSKYILWVLRSPHINYAINKVAYGVKMPRVGTSTMINLLIPLPPIEEQQRIVRQLDTLLPLCNEL